MTILLCDVGGTHIRFALGSENKIEHYKLRVDAHRDLADAISLYLTTQQTAPENITAFYLAFSNRNEWDTTPESLRQALPSAVIRQVNDFEANAHGVLVAEKPDFLSLYECRGETVPHSSKTVIGVGTGLGLAYVLGEKGHGFVQRTHGGHMLPAFAPSHHELYDFLQKGKDSVLIYEDILSGRGLYDVYRYLSAKNFLDLEFENAETLMLNGKDNPVFAQALDIFCEMLGLFAHHAVAFGYAYGGIYLTGGVIDRLMLAGLFKIDTFMKFYLQDNVKIVRDHVESASVFWIRDEFVSLKGLLNLAKEDGHA